MPGEILSVEYLEKPPPIYRREGGSFSIFCFYIFKAMFSILCLQEGYRKTKGDDKQTGWS